MRLWRLARKELRESLRDRRTTLTLILMPILLYPLLGIGLRTMVVVGKTVAQGPEYVIGFDNDKAAQAVTRLWNVGLPSRVPVHFSPAPRLKVMSGTDAEKALKAEMLDVYIRVAQTPAQPGDPLRFEAIYREGSYSGREAVRYLEGLTKQANVQLLSQAAGRAPPGEMTIAQREATTQEVSAVPVLIPLVLILMTMTGAVYPAIDLTAGERERGTLEILMAAPIPRYQVLLAKYIAVVMVALLTACVNLGTMAVTLHFTGLAQEVFGEAVTWLSLLQVLALLVLFALFFSGVLLALTSFARSFKEAQAYLIPLMLVCLFPGVLALAPGLTLGGFLAFVPLVNIVLLARDVLAGTATLLPSLVVVTVTLVYALIAVALAARVFGTEAVLGSGQ
jgi:ABC-2 type transport system permease protein/sodium transport system permease protein